MHHRLIVLRHKPKGPLNRTLITGSALGYGLGIKFVFILACPLLGSFACGIWLDKTLGTRPWSMFILATAGFVFSIYAVYRIATQLAEELKKK
jgi:F0F1-type ATP synthase assembly protein I